MNENSSSTQTNDSEGTNTTNGLERKCRILDRLMWVILLLQAVGTVIMMKYLPDYIPMHFDGSGNADRYGSKYELYGLWLISVFVIMMVKGMLKPLKETAAKAADAREKTKTATNLYALSIAGIATVFIMSGAVISIGINALTHVKAESDVGFVELFVMIENIIIGLVLVLVGNVMPKSRMNGVFGVRTGWSSYNEETWMRSNRAGGKISIATGVVCIIESLLLNYKASSIIMLVLIVLMAVIMIVLSYRIYKDVREKEDKLTDSTR